MEEPTPSRDWTSADEDTHHAGYPVGWLSFSSGAVRKRLRLFPGHWRMLPDADLERLCRRAREFREVEPGDDGEHGADDRSP